MSRPLGAAIGTLRRDKVLMVRWSTNFLAGCWCSTRSSLNFEICGAVPRYRFKISWSVPTYRLDWIVQGYAGSARWHLWGFGPLALMGIMCSGLRVEATPLTVPKRLHSLAPHGTATHAGVVLMMETKGHARGARRVEGTGITD